MTTNQIRTELVQFALRLQGVKEEPFLPNEVHKPGGTNRTIIGKWFGWDGVPWCAQTFSYIMARGANILLKNGGWPKGYASVPQFYANYTKQATKTPKPADAVIYDWNNDGKMDHIGMFIGWLDQEAGLFLAAEGNTTWAGDQSNGGQFLIHDRTVKNVAAFISIEPFLQPTQQ